MPASAFFTRSLRPRLRENGVAEPRPGLLCPVAELPIGEDAERKPARRVDPDEGSAAAPVAERARRGQRAREVRLLSVLELEAEAPVVRVEAAEVGDHARQAGELDARCLGEGLRRDQSRLEQRGAER